MTQSGQTESSREENKAEYAKHSRHYDWGMQVTSLNKRQNRSELSEPARLLWSQKCVSRSLTLAVTNGLVDAAYRLAAGGVSLPWLSRGGSSEWPFRPTNNIAIFCFCQDAVAAGPTVDGLVFFIILTDIHVWGHLRYVSSVLAALFRTNRTVLLYRVEIAEFKMGPRIQYPGKTPLRSQILVDHCHCTNAESQTLAHKNQGKTTRAHKLAAHKYRQTVFKASSAITGAVTLNKMT